MNEALIGLLGVVLGFGLSTGYQEWRDKKQRLKLKVALNEELRGNFHMLRQKREIVEKTLEFLANGRFLPGQHVRFPRGFYEAHYPTLLPELTIRERNSLYVLYEYFRVIDLIMDTYTDRIVEARGTEKELDYMELYSAMLQDLLQLMDLATTIASNHLKGKPDDVFYSDFTYPQHEQ